MKDLIQYIKESLVLEHIKLNSDNDIFEQKEYNEAGF